MTKQTKSPSHTAYVVRNIGEKFYFDSIAALWASADGEGAPRTKSVYWRTDDCRRPEPSQTLDFRRVIVGDLLRVWLVFG